MTASLRPLFEEVIANCEQRGYKHQVDPARLEPGDDIEPNRANFRALMDRAIDAISGARASIP
jgi:hypothetical protein